MAKAAKKTAGKTKAKTATRKTASKKTASTATKKKTVAKKAVARKAPARKASAKKATSRKTTGAAWTKSPTQKAMEQTIKEMTMTTQGTKQFEQFSQDAATAGREGVEAFIKSGTIFTKGMEDLFRTGVSLAQSTAEKQTRWAQEAMKAKSLNEFAEFQSKVAKENFEDFVSSATKLTEMSTKLLSEATEPLNAQMEKSMKKATKMAA